MRKYLSKSRAPIKSRIFLCKEPWWDQDEPWYCCASKDTFIFYNDCKKSIFNGIFQQMRNNAFCIIIEFKLARNRQNYKSRKLLKPVGEQVALFLSLQRKWLQFQGVYFQQI